MKLVVFGLSVSSSWGNGHATTYRALLRAFAARGHEVVFYEWNAPWYRDSRDLPEPDFCELVLYDEWEGVAAHAVAEAREADAALVGSYVHHGARVINDLAAGGVEALHFYDIDTPVTMAQLSEGDTDYLRADQVPLFQHYFSFTGGPFLRDVVGGEFGARDPQPLYCSVDAEQYRPVRPDARFRADLAYIGTYAPDRQPVIERFLTGPARQMPRLQFLVAGPQYPEDTQWPANVHHLAHVAPADHPAFYASADWQLNATRADMVAAGWSPSVRLFEAGACGAAIISDRWPGIEELFTPGREILLPQTAGHVTDIMLHTHPDDRRAIGAALRERILAEHTSEQRAAELESMLTAPVSVG
jgi:spore maturation protein CgeB